MKSSLHSCALSLLLLPLLMVPATAVFGSFKKKPPPEPTRVENFTWTDPFSSPRLRKLEAACTAERTFRADEFLLHDLFENEPAGLAPYADALKKSFTGHPYPGGWDGIDPHMYDRPLLRMTYSDVPLLVREWIEDQERRGDVDPATAPGKNLFAVFERSVNNNKVTKKVAPAKPEKAAMFRPLDARRVVIFAPGAMYQLLPLWVAHGSTCKDDLVKLDRYSPKPKDGSVIAWTTQHTTPDRAAEHRDMTFTIKAQVLKTGEGRAGKEQVRSGKEEL